MNVEAQLGHLNRRLDDPGDHVRRRRRASLRDELE
jgi:hypothetical protein